MVINHLGNDSLRYPYDSEATLPSTALIGAIAEAEEINSVTQYDEWDFYLQDHIDLEAINELVTSGHNITITFRVKDYDVEIDNEQVRVVSRANEA